MEFPLEILIFASIFCCFGGCLVLLIWKRARSGSAVEVNCWFCGKDTQVPHGNKTCWDCPYCEQYNGFTEDGDYNKPIPAQYSENLNHPVCIENRSSDAYRPVSPSLCDTCNRSQLLKVKQLASFVPYTEANYDMEVESYKYHLEQVYKLCRQCQQNVEQVLDTQNRRLEGQYSEYELANPNNSERNQSAMDSIENSFCNSHLICQLSAPWHVTILRFSSLVCAVSLFVTSTLSLLQHSALTFTPDEHLPYFVTVYLHGLKQGTSLVVLLGLVSGLIAIYCFGKSGLHICDAASSITWLSLMAFHSHVTKKFKAEDLILLQALLAGLNMVVCLWGFMCPRYQKASSTRLKKMRRSTNSPFSNSSSSSKSKRGNSPKNKPPKITENIEHEDLEKFETMSIGTPSQSGHGKGVFSINNQGSPYLGSNGSPQQHPSLNSLRVRKPLISPARFKFSNNSPASSTRPRQLFSSSWKPVLGTASGHDAEDRESLFSEARSRQENSNSEEQNSSGSSVSSVCPVDSTNDHTDQACHLSESSKKSILTRVLVGASIGVNVALLLYFWLDFKSFPEQLLSVKDITFTGCQTFFTQVGELWIYITKENFEEIQDVS